MKKLRATFLAAIMLMSCAASGTTVDPIPKGKAMQWDNLTCEEVSELYLEMGLLFTIASKRLETVEGAIARKLWFELKILSLRNHDSLLLARSQKCKSA